MQQDGLQAMKKIFQKSFITYIIVFWCFFMQEAHGQVPATRIESARTSGHKFALLVGVTEYPRLEKNKWLKGPANDVVLMAEVLEKFGFTQDKIVKLSEDAASKRGKEAEPTRVNIEREFKQLAAKANKGDDVFILLSGHGSQQPAAKEQKSGIPEQDGLDETFLPKDIGKWEDKASSTLNAITDDDIFVWTSAIRDKGAFVFLVFDSCHSGTMLRGDDGEVQRDIDMDVLGVPKDKITEAKNAAAALPKPADGRELDSRQPKSGVFALYAAQDDQTAPEFGQPRGDPNAKPHGLLTYNLCSVLSKAKQNGAKVTYRDLAGFMPSQYLALGRVSPVPDSEFTEKDGDTEVFGKEQWTGSRLTISKEKGGDTLKLRAGRLSGLVPGIIFEVMPPLGKDEVIGYVQVGESLTNTQAIVTPVKFRDKNLLPTEKIPDNARCRQVTFDYGEDRLKIVISKSYGQRGGEISAVKVDSEKLEGLRKELQKGSNNEKPWQLVNEPDQANWLVTFWKSDDALSLVPKGGLQGRSALASDRGFKLESSPNTIPKLDETARSIAKVQGLIRLANAASELSDNSSFPKFSAEILLETKGQKVTGKKGQSIRAYGGNGKPKTGDRLLLNIKNERLTDLDLWVFYIDSKMEVTKAYPREISPDQRIKGSQEKSIQLGNIKSSTVGQEHLVVIGVKANAGNMTDLSGLAGKGPEVLRGLAERGGGMEGAGARRVLLKYVFGEGKSMTRSIDPEVELGDCVFYWFPLDVVPGIRPEVDQ